MATLNQVSTSNAYSSTLNGSIGSGDTSITANSLTGLQAPGVLVIDRQDGSGNNTPTLREYITFTGISSNTLTGVTRGVAGSTAQAHSSGALIEETMSVTHWGNLYSVFTLDHTVTGTHVISTATIANAIIGTLLSVSGASLTGSWPITPTWTFAGGSSGPTTHPGVMAMPQGGKFLWVTALTRTVASAASVVFDILKNGTSIFAGITTPTIVGGGTFVSTASLNTNTYAPGDVLTGQIKTLTASGVITDATLEIRGY